ncbi:hypothetical protein PR048_013480 [Dryococelus australis]|uniref:Uncharacterized protein n=1 Tax=Dryococelus australis TaxID=614101 RepID=A0ABQ9HSA1_9NEOP|nr:hypothetical protein PR048_013480 [Dryococelus australis]
MQGRPVASSGTIPTCENPGAILLEIESNLPRWEESMVEVTGLVKKKRKSYGSMSEVPKKIRLTSHEMGDDCKCQLKCFEVVPNETKNAIITNLNLMASSDEQESYLCGLISVLPVARQ